MFRRPAPRRARTFRRSHVDFVPEAVPKGRSSPVPRRRETLERSLSQSRSLSVQFRVRTGGERYATEFRRSACLVCPRRRNRRHAFNAQALKALGIDPAKARDRGYPLTNLEEFSQNWPPKSEPAQSLFQSVIQRLPPSCHDWHGWCALFRGDAGVDYGARLWPAFCIAMSGCALSPARRGPQCSDYPHMIRS